MRPYRLVLSVVTLTLAMGGCSSSSPPIAVSLSPASPKAIDQGQTTAITATVTNDPSSKGVSWSLKGPGSLSGTTGPSVTYDPPTAILASAQQVMITATSIQDATKTASVQIPVNPYLQVPFQTFTNGSTGVAYLQTIAVTGGSPPFQWSIYNGPTFTGAKEFGSIPDGLTLDVNKGTINGIPTGGGTWFFDATVTDATGASADNGFLSVQIIPTASAANPVPFLNRSVAPTSVSPGAAAFPLNVSGAGFVSGAAVDFNGVALATVFVDHNHLAATVPAADVAVAATASITVVNPTPGGGRSNAVDFQIGAPNATVNFANAPNSPLKIYLPFGLVVADFNEDGKPDLVVSANVKVYPMLGNGDGTFAPASGSPISLPSPPYNNFASPYAGPVAVGDFNKSGRAGLAVGIYQNEAAVVLFGNGNGTFTSSSTPAFTMGAPNASLLSADFDGDGNLDLLAVNQISGVTPVLLLGYGHGAFSAVGTNPEIFGLSSAAGDLNGDGNLDMVIDGKSILLGRGDGTFSQGASLTIGSCVALGDLNGDGKLDLAVCSAAGNTVSILLGNGDGSFTSAAGSPVAVGKGPDAMVLGDFNNDGKLDVAVANYGDGTVTLLLGNGDGTFTTAASGPYAAGAGPFGIAAADFNGDGKLDLAVANLTDGTVSILLQQ